MTRTRILAVLFAFTVFALLFSAVAGAQDGRVFTYDLQLEAYCEDSETGRASFERVKRAVETEDYSTYLEVVTNPAASRCNDERVTGDGNPVEGWLIEELETFTAFNGDCMQVVRFKDVNDNVALSWVSCQPAPLPGQPT